jgi:SAM-dependent methyltransferase
MDEIARYNKERWEALAAANIVFSRPALNLTRDSSREMVDPHRILGPVEGKRVLCLASGGGQQSAAFGLLGAHVTVLDLSETQLQRDHEAATHYGLHIEMIQGDMRDLSPFASDSFDVVWHAHSINFVPSVEPVFDEVARVLRPGGFYHVSCHNPFVHAVDDRHWDGKGYPLTRPYIDGEEIIYENSEWDVWQPDGTIVRVRGPHEYRHTLATMINGLARRSFIILGLWEDTGSNPNAEPGTWDHYMAVAAPYFSVWTRYRPDVFAATP